MPDAAARLTGIARHLCQTLLAVTVALLLVTCTDNPIGPARPGLGTVRVAPGFTPFARNAPLVLDRVRVLVVRPPSTVLVDVTRSFSVTAEQLSLSLPIPLQASSEDLEVTLELFAGPTLLFRGTRTVRVVQGVSPPAETIPVVYQGPGTQIATITIGPRDTTVPFGAVFGFGATARDSQQAAVAAFYVGWTASGGTIDGAGQFTAPGARGTVSITATTPTGITDQTTVQVVAPPASLVKVSGDNQTGSIGTRLALPLVVRVDGTDGQPVQGVAVSFAAATGGGSVDSATVVSDAAGLAAIGATLGGTVGAQSFTATAPGLTAAVFAATGTGGAVKTWTGAVSSAWTTAGNWSPAAVPVATDSVAIPRGTPNAPQLAGTATIRTLVLLGNGSNLDLAGTLTVSGLVSLPDSNSFISVTSGGLVAGSVSLGGFQAFVDASAGGLTVSGATTLTGNRAFVDASGAGLKSFGPVTISGAQAFLQHGGGSSGPISLSSSALWEATGPVTVSGSPAASVQGTASLSTTGGGPAPVVFNGDVLLGGADGRLIPNTADAGFTINGNLLLTGAGRLVMGQATDTVRVNGSVSFGGADETGSLTAGALFVSGNFTQTGVSTSFVGSGGHTVFLNGAGTQTLNFASPGFAASRFHNVILANSTGGVTATSDVYASGTAGVTPTAVRTLSGNGSTLFTTILNVSNFTFTNLLLNFTGSTVVGFDTVTFQGYAPTATPLTITHPGAAAPLPFLNVRFTVPPTTGFYLSATDATPTDGVRLVIDMLNPTPASPGGRVLESNATVNWPASSPIRTWSGAISTDWFLGGNWVGGAAPIATSDVVIPAGTPNQPNMNNSATVNNLTVQAEATLTTGDNTLTVNGNLDVAGQLVGCCSDAIVMNGGFIRGNLGIERRLIIPAGRVVSLNGDLVFGTASFVDIQGELVLGGHTLNLGQNTLSTLNGTGLLTMTDPADQLFTGQANFTGGDETGHLTAGVLHAQSLSQGGVAPASFFASGTHTTVMDGSGSITFQSPGPTASRFQNLIVNGNPVTLQSRVVAGGDAIVSGGLNLGGRTLEVLGNFTIQGAGSRLTMTDALDSLLVGGNAIFAGANQLTFMSAGVFRLGGNLTQLATISGDAFHPSGSHKTVLTGANPTLSFATPGDVPGTSHFQLLEWSGTGTLTLLSDAYSHGIFQNLGAGARAIASANHLLETGGFAAAGPVTFNGTGLRLNMGAGGPLALNNLTFQSMSSTVTQLELLHPGTGGPFTFSNISFTSAPTTGRYLRITDTDGITPAILTVNMVNPTPATDGGFSQALGGAVINWPAGSPVNTWTGAVDTSWNTAGNWSNGQVPIASTDVTIPAGTPFAPFTSGTVRPVRDLTVQSGATLTMGGGGLNVNGSLDAAGLITGNIASFALVGTGTARGNVTGTFFSITVNGSYTLNGRLVAPGITVNGTLTLNGFTALVGSSAGDDFQTSNNGRLVMTNPLDSLIVGGTNSSIGFNGASTAGSLTAGVILMNGTAFTGFTQDNTFNAASYAPSGSHKVVLATAATLALDFATPGTGSHFNILDISAQAPGFSLSTPIRVNGLFISAPSATVPAINGGNRLLTAAGGTQVTGLTLTNAPFAITGSNPVQFDNVRFQGMITTVTQLTVSGPGSASPVLLNSTVFATTPTTGFYLSVNDSDGPTPNPLTVTLANPTPATPGAFTQVINGAVINWPATAPTVTWTGAVSTDWSTPGNWSTTAVPTSADAVVIPGGTARNPVVTGACQAKSIRVNSTGQLNLGAFNCQVQGGVRVDGTTQGTGSFQIQAPGQVQGNLRGLIINAPVSQSDIAAIIGDLSISGAGASFSGNGFSATVNGNLSVQNSGLLVMQNPADRLNIQGNATFDGGNEAGSLTAGILSVGATFTQAATTSGASFQPSGTHETAVGSDAQTITFATPGSAGVTSRFQNLTWTDRGSAPGTLTLGSDVVVAGMLQNFNVAPRTFAAGIERALTARQLASTNPFTGASAPLVFSNVRLVLNGGIGTPLGLDNVTFQGFGPGSTQLQVQHPGGSFIWTGLTFSSTPSTGFYLRATDANPGDGLPLVINITGTSPANGSPFFQQLSGATVNWPATPAPATWTGAVDTDWRTPGNWSGGVVPGALTDVTIPAATPTPLLSDNVVINSLTVNAGASLNIDVHGIAMFGDATVDGVVTGDPGNSIMALTGVARTLRGTINAPLTVAGSYTLNGNLTTNAIVTITGDLGVAGRTLSIGAELVTAGGTGRLIMTNPADNVLVGGSAFFDGGDTQGLLTAGTLRLASSFGQIGTARSFAPSGTHKTTFVSALPTTISFATPGAGAAGSHFQVLDLSGATGGITLQTANTIADSVIATTAAAKLIGGGRSLTMRRAQISGLTVDNAPLSLDEQGVIGAENLSNITFQNFPTTGAQLLRISGPGSDVGLRPAFGSSNLNFPSLPAGAGNLYVRLTSTNGQAFIVTMTGSNQSPQSGGNGPALSDPPNQTTVNGARINWP